METGDKERAHAQAVKFPLEINSIFNLDSYLREIPKMAHK